MIVNKADLTPQLPKGETVIRAFEAHNRNLHPQQASAAKFWADELRGALAEDVTFTNQVWRDQQEMVENANRTFSAQFARHREHAKRLANRLTAIRAAFEAKERVDFSWQLSRLQDELESAFGLPSSNL